MIKIIGNDIWRDAEKVGWLQGDDIFGMAGRKLGFIHRNEIHAVDGRKLGYVQDEKLHRADGTFLPVSEVLKDVSGGAVSELHRVAIKLLL